MPSKQRHRGKNPQDDRLFSAKYVPVLRSAVQDLSYLFTHRYSEKGAVKIVGDHYQLTQRQRRAVLGGACSDASLEHRAATRVDESALRDATVVIDGYNALITIESALSGGLLLRGRDGCIRDLASLHGSYRKVEETGPALRAIGEFLSAKGVAEVHWYFDAPVSNSGRLKAMCLAMAEEAGWTWQVSLTRRTDHVVAGAKGTVVTSDSWILDRADAWFNLTARRVQGLTPPPEIVDLNPVS
ncbi:MAG: DUF434 domain-containing protein [bacterium]|nr:DUF434 domain-containing protein [bacterium]